jgi:hypothetical protein
MSHLGAEILESEEREAATGRSRNVVHILPQSMDSVPRFLTGPLERIDPIEGKLQLVVVTADAESAVALAEAVLRMTGPAGIELFPVTSARRAARVMVSRPVLAIAGTPEDLAGLIGASQVKLDEVQTVIFAWADDLFAGDPPAAAALDVLMSELPKDSARIVVTDTADKRVDAFVERYLRRARRLDEQETVGGAEPVSLKYLTVSAATSPAALRRLLDDVDPPSAAIVVGSEDAETTVTGLLRTLGYAGDNAVTVTRGDDVPATHTVVFYGMPASRHQLATAAAVAPVSMIAMIQPRELAPLRRMAGGEVKPFTLSEPGKAARDLERALRAELSGVLEGGTPPREVFALEPLLERYDGIEIAAAALKLLERERSLRKNAAAATKALAGAASVAATPGPRPPAASRSFDRDRPPRRPDPRSDRSEGRPSRGFDKRGGGPRERPSGGRPPQAGGRPRTGKSPRDRS